MNLNDPIKKRRIEREELIRLVQNWFVERGLDTLDGSGQLIKLQEEVDELKEAYIQINLDEEIDAVGDITVVLIGYCMQRLESAYHEIKDRKGKVINGVFVKEVQ